jgi:hypothetical protein
MSEPQPSAVRVPATENPFGVEIWDCTSFTQSMLSTTGDPQIAARFLHLRASTGAEYRDRPIDSAETGAPAEEIAAISCDLAYPYQGEVRDGAVFKAECMEDKWDIYLYSPYLYFVRSWGGQLIYRAKIRAEPGAVRVSQIEVASGEDPEFTRQAVDFLIQSHLLGLSVPHPLPQSLPAEAVKIAVYSFSSYGRRCRYGAYGDTTRLPASPQRRFRAVHAILYGTLVVGLLDGLDAIVFFGLRGAQPHRIFQSIASGLLGRDSFQGGAATAALGVALHFFIAFGIVLTYWLMSRRWTLLLRRPVVGGLLYGLAAYAVMNYVVIPLSAAARPAFSWPVFINGLLIHALGVGLPSALFVRAAEP